MSDQVIIQLMPSERFKLRAEFAKAAMQGLLASRGLKVDGDERYINKVSRLAVEHADALLEKLEERVTNEQKKV